MEMLLKAYNQRQDDPYIIDSVGWAYYLTEDYLSAEKYLKNALLIMPEDPIVNELCRRTLEIKCEITSKLLLEGGTIFKGSRREFKTRY